MPGLPERERERERDSFASSEHITVSLCAMRHRALFTVHYGPPRVIALMKFKPQASLDVEMHFATINSLAGDAAPGILTRRGLMREEHDGRIKGVIKQVRFVFRHSVYRRQMLSPPLPSPPASPSLPPIQGDS